jgi:hypothetical protein
MEGYGASWSMDCAEIRELLGIADEEFYRRIYAAESADHPLISLSAATETYSQQNIWEFVSLIELFCGGDTEAHLEKAGIFFSHPEQMEILGLFLGTAAGAVRRHTLDSPQFSAMLRTFGRFEQARDVYIEEFFPLKELIDRAAEAYCGDRSFTIPQLARSNVKSLLEFFFQKHILEPRSIFSVLIDRLLQQAAKEGYAAQRRRRYAEEEQRSEIAADRASALNRARRAMNLEGRSPTLSELKAQYKRLMKIYHPDINPQGLRRCQEITAAYSLLLSAV